MILRRCVSQGVAMHTKRDDMARKKKLTPELEQYQTIGTVDECRRAMEEQTAKRPRNRRRVINFNLQIFAYRGDYPSCEKRGLGSTRERYCPRCGQAIDWEEGELRMLSGWRGISSLPASITDAGDAGSRVSCPSDKKQWNGWQKRQTDDIHKRRLHGRHGRISRWIF